MKKEPVYKITVVGDGGWGTTLAVHLANKGHAVTLWGPFPEYIQNIRTNRYNPKFLPGIRIPQSIHLEENLKAALEETGIIVFAIPSQFARSVLKKMKATKIDFSSVLFTSVTKGIETQSLKRISEIIREEIGNTQLAVLSGPTIAMEVAQNIPSTAVVACVKRSIAKKLQTVFNSESFRIYTNSDIIGVEIGGSIKNIIALACGVCDGLKLGSNTKAAILTRGLAEMARLGKKLGGKTSTFTGLTGLGDLATTCFSPQSRNRTVGEKIGSGKNIKDILSSMEMVAEGVETAKAVYKLSQKLKVDMPITREVYNIVTSHKSPEAAVNDLMTRKLKSE